MRHFILNFFSIFCILFVLFYKINLAMIINSHWRGEGGGIKGFVGCCGYVSIDSYSVVTISNKLQRMSVS